MSVRVHKLAKELGLTSKELMDKLHALKVDAKGHMSSLEDDVVEIVRREMGSKPKKKPAKKAPKKKTKAAPKEKVKEKAKEKAKEAPKEKVPPKKLNILKVKIPLTVKELSIKLSIKPSELIAKFMSKGVFANINQNLGQDVLGKIIGDFGYDKVEEPPSIEQELLEEIKVKEKEEELKKVLRSPVVTFMGHVDHGKTSLLDYIRNTSITKKEKGGITQHIGAYQVSLDKGAVTFLDTPGHEAFTAMRARGANATDVVVLVVAADDGIMPQTVEAIHHARAAGVPIVVAMNKCDLPGANIDKVKKQLAQENLLSEDWGGKTIAVPVSAKTGEGVKNLLEMLLLEAELLELKANPDIHAKGVVIEGKLSPGRGVVATLLVKNGTLRVGDVILSGLHYGRVKAMINDKGERISEAPPSTPVEILGLSGVPQAGDEFFEVKDEKKAKILSQLKQSELKTRTMASGQRISLEELYENISKGVLKELRIILKGDVSGSIEALQRSLEGLSTKEVQLKVIHSAVGNITESDIMLAVASNAIVIGFHVKIETKAQATSEKEKIDIKIYGIIYEAIADIKAAMEGLLEPIVKDVFLGKAEVRQVFKVSKIGTIAGCYVTKGRIPRNAKARLSRSKKIIFEGKIISLKHFKNDIKDAREGFECGIGFGRHNDIKSGDIIDVYTEEKTTRRL